MKDHVYQMKEVRNQLQAITKQLNDIISFHPTITELYTIENRLIQLQQMCETKKPEKFRKVKLADVKAELANLDIDSDEFKELRDKHRIECCMCLEDDCGSNEYPCKVCTHCSHFNPTQFWCDTHPNYILER
ncbi:MAG: hypothetical protein MJZ34_02680 [Paludibacteraceae bacterium]|nr:hypothetical protein [Paludibacteraceae bacterium]